MKVTNDPHYPCLYIKNHTYQHENKKTDVPLPHIYDGSNRQPTIFDYSHSPICPSIKLIFEILHYGRTRTQPHSADKSTGLLLSPPQGRHNSVVRFVSLTVLELTWEHLYTELCT